MQPLFNDNHKRTLPLEFYNNNQPQAKKIKPNDDDLQMSVDQCAQNTFSSCSSEEDYTSEIDLADIEATELTDELNNLPEIWHCAKKKDWDGVKSLLETCSPEDLQVCPQTGPDKNKTLMILAILSERWDIVHDIIYLDDDDEYKIFNVYKGEKTFDIPEFNKLFELVILNKQWDVLNICMVGAHLPTIDLKLIELCLDQAIKDEVGLRLFLMYFMTKYPLPINNRQFNDILSNWFTSGKYFFYSDLEFLNTFFSIYSHLQLNEDVLKELYYSVIGTITAIDLESNLEQIKDKKKFMQSVLSLLIDVGMKIPNIHELNFPIFNTFERIAVLLQWSLPTEINYKIALDLIRKELPILKGFSDAFLWEKLWLYISYRTENVTSFIPHIVSLAFMEFRWQNGLSGHHYTKTEIDHIHQLIEEYLKEYIAAHPDIILTQECRECITKEIGKNQHVECPTLDKSFVQQAIITAMKPQPIRKVSDLEETVNAFETIEGIAMSAYVAFCDENGIFELTEIEIMDFYRLIETCLEEFAKQHPKLAFTDAKIEALVKEIGKAQNVEHPKLKKSYIEDAICKIMLG